MIKLRSNIVFIMVHTIIKTAKVSKGKAKDSFFFFRKAKDSWEHLLWSHWNVTYATTALLLWHM